MSNNWFIASEEESENYSYMMNNGGTVYTNGKNNSNRQVICVGNN